MVLLYIQAKTIKKKKNRKIDLVSTYNGKENMEHSRK